jgi:selenocysteine lyase/cysteine desulfurase
MHGGYYSIFNTDLSLNEAIEPLVNEDTKIIICSLCSNVTGKSINLSELSAIARRHNLDLILDASQYIGHIKLDLKDIYYTALCSAGHKSLFGIQGSGFAIINDTMLFDTIVEGGSGVDSFSEEMPLLLPERYEAGTLATPAIVSLGAGVKYLSEIGINNVETKLRSVTQILNDELKLIPGLTLYGSNNGIASFNVRDLTSSYVSGILDENNIATRSGFHCSPLIHNKLGTRDRGAVRVSLSYFNTENEIYKFISVLSKI